MKNLMCILISFLIITSSNAFSRPGNFKKGDTWKYSYIYIFKNTSVIHSGPSHSGTSESTTGSIAFSLDSIIKTGDQTSWYVTEIDSLIRIKPRDTLIGTSDTTQQINSIYHHIFIISGDSMNSGSGDKSFFSFNPTTSSTTTASMMINDTKYNAFLTKVHDSSGLLTFQGETVIDTAIEWVDTFGLCQKTLTLSYHGILKTGDIRFSRSYCYTLIKQNGKKIIMQPTATDPKGNSIHRNTIGLRNTDRFFDLQGRALNGQMLSIMRNCAFVGQSSKGWYDVKTPMSQR